MQMEATASVAFMPLARSFSLCHRADVNLEPNLNLRPSKVAHSSLAGTRPTGAVEWSP